MKMLSTKVHPGLARMIFARLVTIVLWHVTIQTLVLQFIASLDLTNVHTLFLISRIKNIQKLKLVAVIFLQLLSSSLFVFVGSYNYLRFNSCQSISRIRFHLRRLSPINLLWILVYFIRSFLIFHVFNLAFNSAFGQLKTSSVEGNVNEDISQLEHLLLLNSFWIHVISFVTEVVCKKCFNYFPLIRKNYFSFVPVVLTLAKDSAIRSVYYSAAFIAFYPVFGTLCYNLFPAKVSFSTLLRPSTTYAIWLFNAYFFFNNFVLKLLFDVFLTKWIKFPVANNPDTVLNELTLKDAMANANIPVLQYLTYYDLNIISQFDAERRKQIFMLSYPGGHPHTWRELSTEAIRFITEASDSLTALSTSKIESLSNHDYSCEKYFHHMRPLTPNKSAEAAISKKEGIIFNIGAYFMRIKTIAFLFEDMKEIQLETILQHYQALSLACCSIANFARISKLEDRFGIVQQDLNKIINALLRLYVSLNKINAVISKNPNQDIWKVRKNLLTAVKSSLYDLSINFGQYVKDINLSPEDEKIFENFINFKN